jgi:hypothetical protein
MNAFNKSLSQARDYYYNYYKIDPGYKKLENGKGFGGAMTLNFEERSLKIKFWLDYIYDSISDKTSGSHFNSENGKTYSAELESYYRVGNISAIIGVGYGLDVLGGELWGFGGAGLSFLDAQSSFTFKDRMYNVVITNSPRAGETRYIFQFSLGKEFKFTKNFGIFVEPSYRFIEFINPGGGIKDFNGNKIKFNFSGFYIIGGIKFNLGEE